MGEQGAELQLQGLGVTVRAVTEEMKVGASRGYRRNWELSLGEGAEESNPSLSHMSHPAARHCSLLGLSMNGINPHQGGCTGYVACCFPLKYVGSCLCGWQEAKTVSQKLA